jgi:arginine repressor
MNSGLHQVISNEEALLLDVITQAGGHVSKHKLDARQAQVARELTHRQVLTRHKQDGKICYKLPADHTWRI